VFVFEVELLMEAEELLGQPQETRPEEAAEAQPQRRRVLLAEDHIVNQKVVQALIGDRFDLMMVGDGQAAVEAFKSQHFDLILMDTHMPVMDGLTAIRQMRALEANAGQARTPIVSLTADALAEHIEIAYRAGADAHLAKPITAASLLATLAAVEDGMEAGEPLKATA
jgi:CheY-like chemotaxis protein